MTECASPFVFNLEAFSEVMYRRCEVVALHAKLCRLASHTRAMRAMRTMRPLRMFSFAKKPIDMFIGAKKQRRIVETFFAPGS